MWIEKNGHGQSEGNVFFFYLSILDLFGFFLFHLLWYIYNPFAFLIIQLFLNTFSSLPAPADSHNIQIKCTILPRFPFYAFTNYFIYVKYYEPLHVLYLVAEAQ